MMPFWKSANTSRSENKVISKGFGAAREIVRETGEALGSLTGWERAMHVFWLLGPFILLIERSPADLWLTLIALTFAGRSIVLCEGSWLSTKWVRLAFLFWAACLVSAALSPLPAYSLVETFVWFRFPLFAMATVFWLGRDRRLLYAAYASAAIGMMIMCGILAAEILLEGHKNGRLSWPYGDLVPGGYLAKATMPAFVVMVALIFGQSQRLALGSALLVSMNFAISLLTGERINFLLRLCSACVASIVWRLNPLRLLIILLGAIGLILAVMYLSPITAIQFTQKLHNGVTGGFQSDYIRVLGGGVVAFEQAPILGIGPANYRILAPELLASMEHLRPDNHPHNFYLQLLAETGVIGMLTGTIFLWSIVWFCFSARKQSPDNVLVATAFIVPFGMFWPIATMADFFGQWNNIFMWSGIALAMAAANSASSNTRKS